MIVEGSIIGTRNLGLSLVQQLLELELYFVQGGLYTFRVLLLSF